MSFFDRLLGRDNESPAKEEEEGEVHLTFDLLRLEPSDPGLKKNRNTDRLTDLLVILFIFGIGTWFRFYVLQFATDYHTSSFDITIPDNDPLGIGSWLGVAPGTKVPSEGYGDFNAYYLDYVKAYADGWNPYSGNRDPYDILHAYVYGPYYMLSIGFGAKFLGMSAYDSIMYSNIILDSLTYVMVYILAKRVTGNVWAMTFALLGSFSPLSIYYMVFKGLNAPIMNLSFLVSLWLYLERRDAAAIIVLAFATLTKQFPLFFAMPMGFWMMRRHGILKGISYIILFIIMFIVLSIPHILIFPVTYFAKLVLPGGGKSVITCPAGGEASNLVHGSIPAELCDANGNAVDPNLLPQITKILDFLVNNHILFFASLLLLGWVSFTAYHVLEKKPKLYYVFTAAYYFIAHATIARGVYKYYLVFLVPLLLLAFLPGNSQNSLNIKLGGMLKKGWSDWFNPKYRTRDATITYWLNGLFLLIASGGVLWLISNSISLFTTKRTHYNIWMLITIPLALYFIFRPNSIKEDTSYQVRDEKINITRISVLLIAVSIAYYYLRKLIDMYFEGFTEAKDNHIILMAAIIVSFILISITNYLVTDRRKMIQVINFENKQLVLDIIWFVIAFLVISYFHIEILTIFRLMTTTFLLYFSFLLMAMLGHEVWVSTIRFPQEALHYYFLLRYEIFHPMSVEK